MNSMARHVKAAAPSLGIAIALYRLTALGLLTEAIGINVLGTFAGVLVQGLIQTYITFDGTLSSWWTKIVVGSLLFAFILLHRILIYLSARRASGPKGARIREQPA